jgi:predicted RNA-binding Zn-ribbon protein involved in translation (DUF1610 family)
MREEPAQAIMDSPKPEPEKKPSKTSAHVCPRCGFSIDLEELGLRAGTTGLVTCPKCDWSGPIEIRIISKKPAD